MNGPVVCVIIPAYNRVEYIDQTISSVLEQTYSHVDLIVVDDGSTDGTLERIQTYGDRLTLLTHENCANKGQSASLNLGLKAARGEYIAVLDSDDYWHPDKLDVQVGYLERNPGIGLLYTNGYAVDSDGNIIYPMYPDDHRENNDPNNVLLDCYILLPQNSLVRKSVYNSVGHFEESYRAAQDHDMLIRISENTQFAYLPDRLFYYRVHDDSISGKNQKVRWKNGFRILANAAARYPYRASTIRKRKAVLNYRLGSCSIEDGEYLKSIGYMIKAFSLDPKRSLRIITGMEKRR
ncbi:MAG: glycosyltransferase [Pseudomonadota bacterium]